MSYIESCPSPGAYTTEAAIVAAQSCAVQAERLEAIADFTQLTWFGVWAIVGLTLVLLVIPFWVQAFPHERAIG